MFCQFEILLAKVESSKQVYYVSVNGHTRLFLCSYSCEFVSAH